MATMTFRIDDASTGGANPDVRVTISENADGSLGFSITQQGRLAGDLRGVFFDVADESLIGTLKIGAAPGLTEFRQGNDTIKDLGHGANMEGLLGSVKAQPKVAGAEGNGYDAGIEIGSAGAGRDDLHSFGFTLSSNARAMTLADFANVDFAARLTSVTTIGNGRGGDDDGPGNSRNDNSGGTGRDDGAIAGEDRGGSAKLLEHTFTPVSAQNDAAGVAEDAAVSGNVLVNDKAGLATSDAVTVTGWSGGALGAAVALPNAAGATLQIGADGSYALDASAADALSAGEMLSYSFTYDAKNQNDTTSWATDTAALSVTVTGINDAPIAREDVLPQILENQDIGGNVLANDTDVDRLDVLKVASVNGVADGGAGDLGGPTPDRAITVRLASGALASMNTDTGGFSYFTNGAFGALNAGQPAMDAFQYMTTDGHGGTAVAQVRVPILGISNDPVANPDAGSVTENGSLSSGNLLANDTVEPFHSRIFLSYMGGAIGQAVSIADAEGATVTMAADGTWTLDGLRADALSQGESVSQTFDYTMSDGAGRLGHSIFTVTVNGVNDAPIANLDSGAVVEHGPASSGNLLANDFDVDRLDSIEFLSFSGGPLGQPVPIPNAAGATVTVNADGTWALDAPKSDVLSAGQEADYTFQYTIQDNHGVQSTGNFSVAAIGANDAPVAVDDPIDPIFKNQNATGNVLTNDSDVDQWDKLTVATVKGVSDGGAEDLGGPTPDGTIAVQLDSHATVVMDTASGQFNYITNGAFNWLGTGQQAVDSFQYNVSDGHGGNDTASVSLPIKGFSIPAPQANTDVAIARENSPAAFGDLVANDFLYEGRTANTFVSWTGGAIGLAIPLGFGASLTVDGNGRWTLDASGADALSEGDSLVKSYQYTIQNSFGVPATGYFYVTVNGANDAPVANDDAIASIFENQDASGNVRANDVDVDLHDSLAVTAVNAIGAISGRIVAPLPSGAIVEMDMNSGIFTYHTNGVFNYLNSGQNATDSFQYTLSDNHGGTDTATVSLTIQGVDPAPVALPDARDDVIPPILENQNASGDVRANDLYAGGINNLRVVAINGIADGAPDDLSGPGNGIITVHLTSGANVQMDMTGNFTYFTNGVFNALASGQQAQDSFQYTVSDNNGHTDTATVRLTIDGVDPAPTTGQFPTMSQSIQNVVLYLGNGTSAPPLKVMLFPGGAYNDIDALNLFTDFIPKFSARYGPHNDLVGISILTGNEYPDNGAFDGTMGGEGPFYFLHDSDSPQIVPIGTLDPNTSQWTYNWNGTDDFPLSEVPNAAQYGMTSGLLQAGPMIVFSGFSANGGLWLL